MQRHLRLPLLACRQGAGSLMEFGVLQKLPEVKSVEQAPLTGRGLLCGCVSKALTEDCKGCLLGVGRGRIYASKPTQKVCWVCDLLLLLDRLSTQAPYALSVLRGQAASSCCP